MNYSLALLRNPQNRNEAPKYYAKAQATGTVDINEIAEAVSYATSLTDGDVLNVIRALIRQLKVNLTAGRIVKLETLGTFQLQLRSTGAAKKEEFTRSNIIGASVQFGPGTLMKDVVSIPSLPLTRVVTRAVAASQGGEDTPDLPDNPGGNTGGDDVDDPNG